MRLLNLAILVIFPALVLAQSGAAPDLLPAAGAAQLARSLESAAGQPRHIWRDTPPQNADGTVNAYIEIPRGERQKFEFDMRANARAVDRVMPDDLAYPINYGFVPQTVSYDGDPFDALVLGPPLPGGTLVRGVIVGLMLMEDEKGLDSKVVLSVTGRDGKAVHTLTAAEQQRVGDYFKRYKLHEPGKFSKVPGWGSSEDGLSFVTTTHLFFQQCRDRAGQGCRVTR